MAPPTPDEMRRLTLIRHLYNIGVSQSREAEPKSGLALLAFHDAAEMFLQLACEHNEVGAKKPDFIEYWAILSGKGINLSQQESMRRLNAARVNLKHRGLLSAGIELESLRAATTNFLQENTEIAFGISFDQISLTALIADKDIAQYLVDAEKAFAQKNYGTSLANSKTAFILSLRAYEIIARSASHQIYNYTLRSSALGGLSQFDAYALSNGLMGDASRAARNVANAVHNMASSFSEAIRLLDMV